jgi:hypothetical protein
LSDTVSDNGGFEHGPGFVLGDVPLSHSPVMDEKCNYTWICFIGHGVSEFYLGISVCKTRGRSGTGICNTWAFLWKFIIVVMPPMLVRIIDDHGDSDNEPYYY